MRRSRAAHDDVRSRLLRHAADVVRARGPEGLSLRRLAESARTSTWTIHALFGSKEGLLGELAREAVMDFDAAQARVPMTADPVDDLVQIGMAYWTWGVTSPQLYDVIFGRPLAGTGSALDVATAARAASHVLRAARRCVDGGWTTGPAERLAFAGWATAHGLVMLTTGHAKPLATPPRPAQIRETLQRATVDWLVS